MGQQDREQTRAVASRNAWADLAVGLNRGEVVSCSSTWHRDHQAALYRLPDAPADHWICDVCHPNLPGRVVEFRGTPAKALA